MTTEYNLQEAEIMETKVYVPRGVGMSLLLVLATLTACGGGDDTATDTQGVQASSQAASDTPPERAQAQAFSLVPRISTQPQAQSVLTGARATFRVVASGWGVRYQWRRNGVAISGATSSSYTAPAASYRDHGASYTVTVSSLFGSVTSNAATLNLTLSADQRVYEAEGGYQVQALLRYPGENIAGFHAIYSFNSPLPASPLTNGPQTVPLSAPENMARTLPVAWPDIASRRLIDGRIVALPVWTQLLVRVSYVGSDIKVENLLPDGATVVSSNIHRDLARVPLTGLVTATPPDLARSFDTLFRGAATFLRPDATYAAGASYLRSTYYTDGDFAMVQDCGVATNQPMPTPCATGTTLTQALTAGVRTTDGRTRYLSEGTVSTVLGATMWIDRDTINPTSTRRLMLFELGGNIYQGLLTRHGERMEGALYIIDSGLPTGALSYQPHHVRLNRAARDSLAAALTF
jgi:hypothetical protein